MSSIRQKTAILVASVTLAVGAVASGRATEDQINQALGITPTATLSAEQLASATEAAQATSTARALAASSPGAVAQGDVSRGRRQFQTWCAGCHSPGGQGPDILAPGSAGADVTADSLMPLVREGEGHTPPGPYGTTQITNNQLIDIAAYISSEAGG